MSGEMTHRQRALAILRYEPYDRMPICHFAFWGETLEKWEREGHITREDIEAGHNHVAEKLGFEFDWSNAAGLHTGLEPALEGRIVKEFADGSRHVCGSDGVVYLDVPGAQGIPPHIDHLLKDRDSWEEHFKWRLQWSDERINHEGLKELAARNPEDRNVPLGVSCGSLIGGIRGLLGVEGLSYLYVDDEELFTEIIDTNAELCYRGVETMMKAGVKLDFGHFWEDICFRNGPLVSPSVFEKKIAPHYKRITRLLNENGIDLVSVDCDGLIDDLVPLWVENGVNVMFPIEVGVWDASLAPWREKYGRSVLGVGGMNKTLFAHDRSAIDGEIERLRPLVELGGFIPCPDHRIAPDARYELVQYYCDRMRKVFG